MHTLIITVSGFRLSHCSDTNQIPDDQSSHHATRLRNVGPGRSPLTSASNKGPRTAIADRRASAAQITRGVLVRLRRLLGVRRLSLALRFSGSLCMLLGSCYIHGILPWQLLPRGGSLHAAARLWADCQHGDLVPAHRRAGARRRPRGAGAFPSLAFRLPAARRSAAPRSRRRFAQKKSAATSTAAHGRARASPEGRVSQGACSSSGRAPPLEHPRGGFRSRTPRRTREPKLEERGGTFRRAFASLRCF